MKEYNWVKENPECDKDTNSHNIAIQKCSKWIIGHRAYDEYAHHMCSNCKKDAIFNYVYVNDYAEGFYGAMEYVGQREDGISEFLTDYCPSCGAVMEGL